MNRRIWVIAFLALACGGTDESAAFVGTWPGVLQDVGFADGISRTVVIERAGSNELTIRGLCDAPISADVESATTFSFGSVRNCLTTGTTCSGSQLSLDGGTGTLMLNGMSIDMQGGLTSCGALVGGVHIVFVSNQASAVDVPASAYPPRPPAA
jgi:hypothetical protein